MPTLESLKRRLNSAQQLQSVVKTMKSIAAAGVRQFEQGAEAVTEYRQTVEKGLQVIVLNRRPQFRPARVSAMQPHFVFVFGSSQGMCGQFNEDIVSFAARNFNERLRGTEEIRIVAVGDRVIPALTDELTAPIEESTMPSSVRGITYGVQMILSILDRYITSDRSVRVTLYHNRKRSGASYRPRQSTLIPLDEQWLADISSRDWPSRSIPAFRMAYEPLLAGLIRQYLFVTLYQAFAESLAAENASRLAAMQAAESHIEKHLEDLESVHNHLRQDSITSELLDIASGYEALEQGTG